jgi:hypothetical protein
METYWNINSQYLEPILKERLDSIDLTKNLSYSIEKSKTELPILKVGDVYLHSRQDPIKESFRLSQELPNTDTERIYLYLGAGLGYIIQESLRDRKTISGVWLEADPFILKYALTYLDFSNLFKLDRLSILLAPITEGDLYLNFKGRSTVPVSFIPHRGSLTWNEEAYNRLRYIGESFFHKKDVNLATLVRFEKIWTKNMIQNITEVGRLHPISKIFGIAQGCPILVAGAGPSLSESLDEIIKYRERFILIAVDTALHVLYQNGIDPDLVYSVDPQFINSFYLEGYDGKSGIVFDPTSTYLSPRLEVGFRKGFFTTTPFPLTKILQDLSKVEIGSIPFGGSVSTNAISLARLMGGSSLYMVGQDLSFSDGLAHAKGAVLEERLNWKETRRNRRELHNYRQLTALPKHWETSLSGSKVQTNEKLIIFRNWFQENCKDVINLTKKGILISGLTNSSIEKEFTRDFIESSKIQKQVEKTKQSINDILEEKPNWLDSLSLQKALESLKQELDQYLPLVTKGKKLSTEIYNEISSGREAVSYLQPRIKKMDELDELVSAKKNLGEILSTSMQRVIFSITEGFDSELNSDEKEKPRLGIAKKSVLLYEGLESTSLNLKSQIARTILRSST